MLKFTIITDEKSTDDVIRFYAKTQQSTHVESFRNLIDASHKLKQEGADIIFLDTMHMMYSYDAAWMEILETQKNIVLITPYPNSFFVIEHPNIKYKLFKPFSLDEFQKAINKIAIL